MGYESIADDVATVDERLSSVHSASQGESVRASAIEPLWSRLSTDTDWKRVYKLREAVLEAWAKIGPRDALDFTRTLRGEARDAAQAVVLGAWLQSDFTTAMAWVCEERPGFLSSPVFREVVRTRGDFASTLEMISNLKLDRTTQRSAIEGIAEDWAKGDAQAAWAALSTAPEDRRTDFALGYLKEWAKNEPAAAAQWAATFLRAGDDRRAGLYRVMHAWVADPARISAATEWIDAQPATSELFNARSEVATALARQGDVAGALAQLGKITDLKNRDEWLYFTAFDVGTRSPEVAVKIVEQVNDPAARYRYVARRVESWWIKDPAAARAYVETTPKLDSTQKQALLARLGAPR